MKRYAQKGKLLYCKELDIYCKVTSDTEHEWIEVDEVDKK